jgi:hypothetical protein
MDCGADAVSEAEGNIVASKASPGTPLARPGAATHRGQRPGHVRKGFPRNLGDPAVSIERWNRGTERKRVKRGRLEVGVL